MNFECLWCRRSIEVDYAGWPYVHSLALLHFHMCRARPGNVTAERIEDLAADVADGMEVQLGAAASS